ncbi:MAG: peptidase M64, partial [Candidatus Marinimicrobia bacterium]|nr:peptidase M64 [Candidatus Neomarinimicrobiota bacterium]
VNIIREKPDADIQVIREHISGNVHEKVDVVFIAEGYTDEEGDKVRSDLEKFSDILFKYEPFKSHKNDFNIYGVFKPSDESGVDEPTHGSFKNTAVSASFNSLGSPRYLLTEDNKSLRDIAGAVPYDAIYIMVNHDRYGGGGIYNLYCTFTTDNQWYEYLFIHEFGHSFSGLADEYYTSSTAYNDFYPRGIEPTERNITALLDPTELKWQDLAANNIEVPTPWNKAEFDSMDMAYQQVRGDLNDQIARLKREGAPASEVKPLEEKSERLSKEHADRVEEWLKNSKYYNKVGAYEGAGYSSEGLYRPEIDCIMFTKGKKPFCEVCQSAIKDVIGFYTE